jgi:hypothetical protein
MKLKNKHMKKLALLTIILFTTLSSFSQTVTKTDSIVPLKVPTAKLVIKDLLQGDGAKAELVEAYKVIDLQKGQMGLYVQKDTLKDQKISNLNLIVDKTTQQRDLAIDMSKSLEKELKVQQLKTKFYKASSFVGIAVAVITTTLYIVK